MPNIEQKFEEEYEKLMKKAVCKNCLGYWPLFDDCYVDNIFGPSPESCCEEFYNPEIDGKIKTLLDEDFNNRPFIYCSGECEHCEMGITKNECDEKRASAMVC